MVKAIAFDDYAHKQTRGRFTAKPLTTADQRFRRMFEELLAVRTDRPNWRFRVRPSALPFCQWEAMLAEVLGTDGPTDQDSWARDFYTEVGHVAHRVTQLWLARLGYLYGPFECERCKAVQISQGLPKECPSGCWEPQWTYLEINLKDADPSGEFKSAHADGLLRFPDMPENQFYLMDIKTTSRHLLPRPEYGLTSQYHRPYLDQTAIYWNLLSRGDHEIVGTVFIFIPRDDPKESTAIVVDQQDTNGPTYHAAVRSSREAKKAAETGDCLAIKRDCRTKDSNPECPYNQICFDRERTAKAFVRHNGKLPILPNF